jgi:hypothetical protein
LKIFTTGKSVKSSFARFQLNGKTFHPVADPASATASESLAVQLLAFDVHTKIF